MQHISVSELAQSQAQVQQTRVQHPSQAQQAHLLQQQQQQQKDCKYCDLVFSRLVTGRMLTISKCSREQSSTTNAAATND
jgi:hypothetical protein